MLGIKKEDCRKLTLLAIFAIAMGFLEAAVVIYLRKIYYPQGFGFPSLYPFDSFTSLIEMLREVATIVMIVCLGIIAGKKSNEKLAYSLYIFALWDIFYYVFLKLFLNWPSSLLTLDSLFLIPVQWVAPVLAPILVSSTLIIISLVLIKFKNKKIQSKDWLLSAAGTVIILYTFLQNYNWVLFAIGLGLIIYATFLFYKRKK